MSGSRRRCCSAAALVGPHGLTLLTSGPGAALASLAGANRWARRCGLAVAALVGLWRLVAGAAPLPTPSEAPVVRLVQPNAPQREKWDPARAQTFFERQTRVTPAAAAPPDLVVWPETALPYCSIRRSPNWHASPRRRAARRCFWAPSAGRGRAPTIRWSCWAERACARSTTSIIWCRSANISRWARSTALAAASQSFAAAGRLRVRRDRGRGAGSGAAGTALPLICYEAIFPQDVARGARAARLDGADHQRRLVRHCSRGRTSILRRRGCAAVEQGLPLVRVGQHRRLGRDRRRAGACSRGFRWGRRAGSTSPCRPPAPADALRAHGRSAGAAIAGWLLLLGAGLTLRRGGA